MIPFVVHILHSSTFVPSDVLDSFSVSKFKLKREILRLTDWYVDELFSSVHELGGTEVVYPVSRLVSDPERLEDDEREVMASRGMGVIYTRTSDGKDLRFGTSLKIFTPQLGAHGDSMRNGAHHEIGRRWGIVAHAVRRRKKIA
jgi:N-formylglutamate amidohydrolase